MQSAEEKLKNVASSTKEQINKAKAKIEEKVEKAAARTPEEKEMAHERRKAREAKAKMELHHAKAKHVGEKFATKHSTLAGHVHEPVTHHTTTQPVVGAPGHQTGHQPVGTADTMTGTTVPTYPLGGHRPHSGHTHKHM
ncbi:late embryogenesis abundant protein 6 [Rhodamnia argentea]|uniref:Late embryogenesis abundant protein 6 n=1 Tax=Rhodamnia argentea TaxID=178133 RepID=A0A8B8PFS2_9MYRT|nr:late embryogenesis abundant protein 6 [Rhodamnia argentea]